MAKKCGYIALLGCPNAGKSTLMNAFLETKIAVVSNKPQTTRNKILGICLEEETQLLFLDTPGIHKSSGLPTMNKIMNNVAWSVLRDADFVCYLIDITRGWTPEDSLWITAILEKYHKKAILVATKSDKLKKEVFKATVVDINTKFNELIKNSPVGASCQFVGDIPRVTSAKKRDDVLSFRKFLAEQLPDSEWLYNSEDLTDKPQKFICAELVREQIFRQLGKEIPYKVAVVIDTFDHKPHITEISATIIVERDSYKSIVIGKGGSKLKSIGVDARASLERHLQRKVFLEMFVKVQKGWTENASMLSEFANLQDPSFE
ncbi:MAG: GTPase Era [Bdellovibrionota bacterium]